MRFTLGGRGGFRFSLRLSVAYRRLEMRVFARALATFDRCASVAFYFTFFLGSEVSRELKRFQAPCFAVKVPLHRAKTRVSYERRVKSVSRRPLLSVPTFRSRIIQAIHLNLPPLPHRSSYRLSSSFSRGIFPLGNYRVNG